jgi:hypothetical protein
MFAGLECALRHRVMGVMHGQVHHELDFGIGEQVVQRVVRPNAVLAGKRAGPLKVGVSHGDEPDLVMLVDASGVRSGDVSAADDANAERPMVQVINGHPASVRHVTAVDGVRFAV